MKSDFNLTFHHTGLAISNMEETVNNYKKIFGESSASQVFTIHSQNVNVCFIQVGAASFLELVEPSSEESSIHRLLKKGHSYYHTAYTTKEIETTVEQMIELNYKPLEYFNSEAFNNNRCIFLFSPEGHLIELIEE